MKEKRLFLVQNEPHLLCEAFSETFLSAVCVHMLYVYMLCVLDCNIKATTLRIVHISNLRDTVTQTINNKQQSITTPLKQLSNMRILDKDQGNPSSQQVFQHQVAQFLIQYSWHKEAKTYILVMKKPNHSILTYKQIQLL